MRAPLRSADSPREGVGVVSNPITFLGASLLAWWTADRADLITLSGAAVTSWKDVTNGYDALQGVSASRPTYSATGFSGAPGVTSDGIDDELTCTDAGLLAALPVGASPSELWAIVQQDAIGTDATVRSILSYGDTSANLQRNLRRLNPGNVNRGAITIGTGAGNTSAINTGVDMSSRHLLRGEVLATTGAASVDGTTMTPGAAVPATAAAARVRLFGSASAAASSFWNGKARDFLITLPLTAGQVTALEAWALPRRML